MDKPIGNNFSIQLYFQIASSALENFTIKQSRRVLPYFYPQYRFISRILKKIFRLKNSYVGSSVILLLMLREDVLFYSDVGNKMLLRPIPKKYFFQF